MNTLFKLDWEVSPIDVNYDFGTNQVFKIPLGFINTGGGGTGLVSSVNGKIGAVVLNYIDVGAEPAGAVQSLKNYVDSKFVNIDEQINLLNIKINDTNTDLGNLESQVNGLGVTVNDLSTTVQGNTDALAAVDVTLADHDSRLNMAFEGLITHQQELGELSANKLDRSEYVQHFKGVFPSYAALTAAYPTADDGDYAHIDSGSGFDRLGAIWDTSDGKWVVQEAGIASNTDEVPEGSQNLYFTNFRAVNAPLTGIIYTDGSPVIDTDTVVAAFGKVQNQLDNVPNLVLGTKLTGLTPIDNIVIPTDTILQGFNKLQGQFNGLNVKVLTTTLLGFSPVNSVVTSSDNVVNAFSKLQGQVNQIVNNFSSAVLNTVLSGLNVQNAVVSATDTILSSTGKLQGQINNIISTLAANVRSTTLTGLVTTTSTPITATDSVLTALGKLQGQANGAGMTWVPVTSIPTFAYNSAIEPSMTKIELCKFGGLVWIRGYVQFRASVNPSTLFFEMFNSGYLPDATYIPNIKMLSMNMYNSSVTIPIDFTWASLSNKWNISTGATGISINTAYHIPPTALFKHV